MRRLLTLLATAFVLLVFPVSAAFAEGIDPTTQAHDELASLDAQIHALRQQLADSQTFLTHWSARLDAAQRGLTLAKRSARAPVQRGPAARYPTRASAARESAKVRVFDAQQRLSTVAADPSVVGALVQVFVLQDQLRALQIRRSHEELIYNVLIGRGDPTAPVDAETW